MINAESGDIPRLNRERGISREITNREYTNHMTAETTINRSICHIFLMTRSALLLIESMIPLFSITMDVSTKKNGRLIKIHRNNHRMKEKMTKKRITSEYNDECPGNRAEIIRATAPKKIME